MPKKTMTPEERKAWGAKMKAAREAKKDVIQEQVLSPEEVRDLVRRVKELELNRSAPKETLEQPRFNSQGQMTGTFEKHVVDPKHYPDPSERLSREPRLTRWFSVPDYELKYAVSTTQYQTQDGVYTREPRFTVELHRIVMDENTGEATNGRYIINRISFHEDPQAALIIANEQNFDVNSLGERDFLNEMRYLRVRDWLFDVFYPPRNTAPKKNKKEMVVGNRLVEYFEINSEDPQSMPFQELKGKL